MKTIRIIFLILCFCCLLKDINAQSVSKKDTIYYLVDLNKIPINDRMLSKDTEGVYHFYQIDCPCTKSSNKPRFLCDEKTTVTLKKNDLLTINFISLPSLIDILKKNSYKELKNKFMIYFIEPIKKKFNKNEVHLLEEYKAETVY